MEATGVGEPVGCGPERCTWQGRITGNAPLARLAALDGAGVASKGVH